MSNVGKLLKAGRLLFWDGKNATKASIPENVTKVFLGAKHSAIIGASGNLYTFGQGKHGQLGHGNSENVTSPKIVDYFEKKNIKIIDVVCSDHSTLALSADGDVYNLGLNNHHADHKKGSWWQAPTSPTLLNAILPVKVPTSGRGKATNISSGHNFHFAVLSKGSTEVWGCGQYGALGNMSTETLYVPTTNPLLEPFTPEERIVKIMSCNYSTAILRANGELYAWGSNNEGQFGSLGQTIDMHVLEAIPTQILFGERTGPKDILGLKLEEMDEAKLEQIVPKSKNSPKDKPKDKPKENLSPKDEQYELPTEEKIREDAIAGYNTEGPKQLEKLKVKLAKERSEKINGTAVVDFDLSEDVLLVKTKDSKIWRLGSRLHFSPTEVALKEKVQLMSAGKGAVAFVTESNQIIEQGSYFDLKGKAEDLTGFKKADGATLFGGKVIGLGGAFTENKYVIIE